MIICGSSTGSSVTSLFEQHDHLRFPFIYFETFDTIDVSHTHVLFSKHI
jgi:hypothetical protein